VSHSDEVEDVRKAGWTGKILVMGYSEVILHDELIFYTVYSYESGQFLLDQAKQ
jgi:hypothetical protein